MFKYFKNCNLDIVCYLEFDICDLNLCNYIK